MGDEYRPQAAPAYQIDELRDALAAAEARARQAELALAQVTAALECAAGYFGLGRDPIRLDDPVTAFGSMSDQVVAALAASGQDGALSLWEAAQGLADLQERHLRAMPADRHPTEQECRAALTAWRGATGAMREEQGHE